jgi:hypothetical protein
VENEDADGHEAVTWGCAMANAIRVANRRNAAFVFLMETDILYLSINRKCSIVTIHGHL